MRLIIFSSKVTLFSILTQLSVPHFLAREKINDFLEETKYAPYLHSMLSTYISRLSTESFNFRNSTGIYIYLSKMFLVSIYLISFFMLWHPFYSSFNILNNYIECNMRGPFWFPACFHTWTLSLRVFYKCALWPSCKARLEHVAYPRSTCFCLCWVSKDATNLEALKLGWPGSFQTTQGMCVQSHWKTGPWWCSMEWYCAIQSMAQKRMLSCYFL